MSIKIYQGNCLDTLKKIESQSINTCITSPPYWGLRDYDESEQLGLEETPEEFVNNLVEVFREVKRVLRDDGTVWLNLGDSYARTGGDSSKKGRHWDDRKNNPNTGHNRYAKDIGLKPKDLVGIPWRVAFALQADGWYLRQDIIWHKPNPMPESVKDRCTKAHEYIFLLSKSVKYYFDNEAIKEDSIYAPDKTHEVEREKGYYKGKWSNPEKGSRHDGSFKAIREKRNKRSVWTVNTKPFKGAHFATFPPDLIKPCVLAGCPEKICADCKQPYVRDVKSKRLKRNELPKNDPRYRPNTYEGSYKDINGKSDAGYTETEDLGLKKQCSCETNKTQGGTVLDPFGGSGTTALLANGHNRNAILCELNEEYIKIAKERLAPDGDLFTDIEVII